LENKISYMSQHNDLLFDLTAADRIDNLMLAKVKKFCKVIKIFSTFKSDLDHLEDVWKREDYTSSQWTECCSIRNWACDQFLFYKWDFSPALDQSDEKIVFTPGRSGTHVLMDVLQIRDFIHHNDNLISNRSNEFNRLLKAKTVFSVLRKELLPQVLSSAIGIKFGIFSTTEENFKEVRDFFIGKTMEIDNTELSTIFNMIAHFVDILLNLRLVWGKDIHFYYLDELTDYFDQITTKKNPYCAETMTTNFDEVKEEVEINLQPIYTGMLNLIQSTINHHIY